MPQIDCLAGCGSAGTATIARALNTVGGMSALRNAKEKSSIVATGIVTHASRNNGQENGERSLADPARRFGNYATDSFLDYDSQE